MSNCIDNFGERMNELMNEYEAMRSLVMNLTEQTRVFLVEDIYFAGLMDSNCEKYRYGENNGFIGVCGNKVFEVLDISYGMKIYPIHDALVSAYYEKLPWISLGEVYLLEMRIFLGKNEWTRILLQTIYPGMGSGNVYVVVPRRSLNDIAKKFHIPTPGLGIDLEGRFVIIEFRIENFHFVIKYTGREGRAYLEGGYPRDFENSPIACAITDAVVKIIEDALDLYEDITNKGMKFMSIFLLY
jgi:hypothetical protein